MPIIQELQDQEEDAIGTSHHDGRQGKGIAFIEVHDIGEHLVDIHDSHTLERHLSEGINQVPSCWISSLLLPIGQYIVSRNTTTA